MDVRLTHLDGKLPNLALMKLAHWHRSMLEPRYGRVYGSAFFGWSSTVIERLRASFPDAMVGGTGSGTWETVEDLIGRTYEHYDYGIYPEFEPSIGFTQRGCRLRCGFCVVPKKEGKPRPVNTIADLWRGGDHPRHILLLDNDFFGQGPDDWQARVAELRDGGFRVAFSQGINIRMVTEEAAEALATVDYRDDGFRQRRMYTAWDNLGDEERFFVGLDRLQRAGIPARHVMVYMLIGYWPRETMDDILYRYGRLKAAGCLPFPMVYNNQDRRLKRFQRWVVRRYDEVVPWPEFDRGLAAAPPKGAIALPGLQT